MAGAVLMFPMFPAVASVSKPEMKLLVVAQIPPPMHGQSAAVAALLDHLRSTHDEVHHINVPLSRDSADIGRWRLSKVWTAWRAGAQARRTLARLGPMPVYYVPAPGKRGALYRDWAILSQCRPRASALILHWHAVGLGEWLETHGTAVERRLAQRYLGGATLAIVQAEGCRADAERLAPARCVVVRNGVADPAPQFQPRARAGQPCEVLFAGLGCAEKGLFDALEGVALANAAAPGAFRLTAVGPFASRAVEAAFRARAEKYPGAVRHLGFVSMEQRNSVLRAADVFCFPSYYPHEGQPAVVLEALANDLPIVATRWRSIPENLPSEHVYLVPPQNPPAIAAALQAAQRDGPAGGVLRRHYLAHHTRDRYLADLTAALRQVAG